MIDFVGFRGKGFLVLFMKYYEGIIKNVYVILEKGVQINIIIFNCLNFLLKLQIDMSLNIFLSYYFIFLNGIEFKFFKREFKLVFIEIFDDVFVVSLDYDDGIVDGIINILIYKLLI